MSLLLFKNGIVDKVKEGGIGIKVGDMMVLVLLFADDMVLMAEVSRNWECWELESRSFVSCSI